MAAIETKQLVHTYKTELFTKPKHALRGLDLVVEGGEIFGYLGANGAGKTTTIKILVGLLRQTGGEARIFDADTRNPESRRAVGFQPENPYFYEYLSAREALAFYAALCDVPRRDRPKRCDELLEFVGLADAADVRMRDFSKGMRQRLGIAQAVVHDPKLVILDEPMSGLDPVGRRRVRTIITDLRDRGLTVFFSSHILSDVEMICDRVGLLVDGRLTASGPVDSLVDRELRSVDVVAEGVSDATAKAVSADATAERLAPGGMRVFSFADWTASDRAVAALAASGARIREVTPHMETLEEYFMRVNDLSREEAGAWKSGADD